MAKDQKPRIFSIFMFGTITCLSLALVRGSTNKADGVLQVKDNPCRPISVNGKMIPTVPEYMPSFPVTLKDIKRQFVCRLSESTESVNTEATTASKTSPTTMISVQSEATTSQATTTSACTSPPLTYQFSESYYNFSTCKVDHVTAVSACSQYGSHLVFIGSKGEQDFIMQQIEDSSEDYWIGLTRNSDMEVTWLDGSRLTVYDNTARWNPFDDGGECIRIDGRSSIAFLQGTWHDKPCDNKLRYICEKEIDPN